MAAKKPQFSDAQYRELIPLFIKHRDENAAGAVIGEETMAQWKAYLQGVLDGIDFADAKDREAAVARPPAPAATPRRSNRGPRHETIDAISRRCYLLRNHRTGNESGA